MNAPQTEGREWALYVAAFEKLMAKAKGRPVPWVFDLWDGECRCLEHVIFEHPIGCLCCRNGLRIRLTGSFCDWPADWKLPLTLILTDDDGMIVMVETEEYCAQ